MIRVSARAHRYQDRAGDPLDGLVNLFDVGVVLAVAFLLAALSSPAVTRKLTNNGRTPPSTSSITVAPGDVAKTVPAVVVPTVGNGTPIGRVYRLQDGRLIYVVPSSALPGAPGQTSSGTSTGSPAPSPTPTPTK